MSTKLSLTLAAISGISASLLAQFLVVLSTHYGGGHLLRGPYGPPFFNIALHTAVFYGMIALGTTRNVKLALLSFVLPLLLILLPLLILTRYPGWGSPALSPSLTPQWQLVMIVIYSFAVWITIAIIGFRSHDRWKGAVASILGALCGYTVLELVLILVPALAKISWDPRSLMASPINLFDGLFSGLGISAGFLALRYRQKTHV